MAYLASGASGNLTAASTWQVVDATSLMDGESGPLNVSGTYVFSQAFTPGAITIDAIGIKLATTDLPLSGTCTVGLQNQTDAVYVEEITFNIADVPPSGITGAYNRGWLFLKLSASATLIAGKNYRIAVKASSTGLISLYRGGVAGNWSRMLRTTTTAAPAADDLLVVAGEFGPNSSASYTVTMDNTVTSLSLSGLYVNYRGTLKWATAASTNYYLAWKNYWSIWEGAVHIGTAADPIPATSTATLLMDSAAASQAGIAVWSGEFNAYGTPPTTKITRLKESVGGRCRASTTSVTASPLSQSFLGLSGTIVVTGTPRVISSVTNGTQLTLTSSVGGSVDTYWVHRASGTMLKVDDTTGWAASGTLVLPGSIYGQTERVIIGSVDSATQVTLSGAPTTALAGCTNYHMGAEPLRTPVGYLTRNVVLRGKSAALTGFFYTGPKATCNLVGIELYWYGRSASSYPAPVEKTGFWVASTTGTVQVQDSSLYLSASEANHFKINVSPNNLRFVGCIAYSTDGFLMDHNVRQTGRIVCTDCLFTTAPGYALQWEAWSAGTFARNIIAETGGGIGYPALSTTAAVNASDAVISDCEFWALNPSSGYAINVSSFTWAAPKIQLNRCRFLRAEAGLQAESNATPVGEWTFNDCTWVDVEEGIWWSGKGNDQLVLNNPTVYRTLYNDQDVRNCIRSLTGRAFINNGTFTVPPAGALPGALYGKDAFTYAPVLYSATSEDYSEVNLSNCLVDWPYFSDLTTSNSMANVLEGIFTSQRTNRVTNANMRVTSRGTVLVDTTISTSGQSVRLKPEPAQTLNGAWLYAAVPNGQSLTVTVKTRESVVGDGKAYNGGRPRLYVQRNRAAGYADDTLLATATSAGSGAFETLSATVGPVTDNAVLKFYVQAGGAAVTQGWVNVDTITYSSEQNTREYDYWSNTGEPLVANSIVTASGAVGGAWPYAT